MNPQTIGEYYTGLVRHELSLWAKRACLPKQIEMRELFLGVTEERHSKPGLRWESVFTGGLTSIGWISLDGLGFDIDKRPDNDIKTFTEAARILNIYTDD